jgi:hypothetical protein
MTERRLTSVEQVVRTVTERRDPSPGTPLDPVEAHLYRLCLPLGLLAGAKAGAEHRATRRALLEGRVEGWTGRPPDWDACVQREREALPAFLDAVTADDVVDALERWADTPDREGWPLPHSFSDRAQPTGAALLRQRMAHTRKLADAHRRQDRPGAIAWRRDHPDWRDRMNEAEVLPFEMAVLASIGPDEEGGQNVQRTS